jgi:hypothetical protein
MPEPRPPLAHVPAPGPLTPRREMETRAPSRISTIAVAPSASARRCLGARTVVARAPAPRIDRSFETDTCSR